MDLQPLLRERDALWNAATPETRAMILATRDTDSYAYQRPDPDPRVEHHGGKASR